MVKVGFVYDDVFLRHETPTGHAENSNRLVHLVEVLRASEIWDRLVRIKPRRATFEDVARVHSKEYIEKLKRFGTGHLDFDTYMSKDSLEAALYAAGAMMEAVDRCKKGEIERAFCAVRPPGHHAEAHRAMGFCIFNNVAVGARYAQTIGYGRIFIIDFDVHHGNGTQHIFEEDDSVFYFSTHQYPHYPGTGRSSERGRARGEGFTFNVLMDSGSDDGDYGPVYNQVLPRLVNDFAPDLLLVSAGYDIHVKDPLSGIRVTDEGIRSIVRGILSSTVKPVIFSLEGGYNLAALARGVKITVEEMLKEG
jgi:acetoin utilization deacetylase AcuC-like enzyme